MWWADLSVFETMPRAGSIGAPQESRLSLQPGPRPADEGVANASSRCVTFSLVTRGYLMLQPSQRSLASSLVPWAPARLISLRATALSMNRGTALDVGIASPRLRPARICTETMQKRKETKYAPFRAELVDAHVAYRPVIWSS